MDQQQHHGGGVGGHHHNHRMKTEGGGGGGSISPYSTLPPPDDMLAYGGANHAMIGLIGGGGGGPLGTPHPGSLMACPPDAMIKTEPSDDNDDLTDDGGHGGLSGYPDDPSLTGKHVSRPIHIAQRAGTALSKWC